MSISVSSPFIFLKRLVVRAEPFGGIAYVPEYSTYIAINKQCYRIISTIQSTEEPLSVLCNRFGIDRENAKNISLEICEQIMAYINQYKNVPISKAVNKKKIIHAPTGNIGRLSAPIRILLEITSQCNLNCIFCYAYNDKNFDAQMTTNEIQNIVDQCKDMNVFGITLIGGGEPFVHKNVVDIISYIQKFNISTSIVTNGTLLLNYKDKLSSLNPKLVEFFISLHGSNPGIYEKYTGDSDNFYTVVEACKLLRKQGFQIGIKSVISKINWKDIPSLILLADSLGARSITLLQFHPSGKGKAYHELGYFSKSEMREIIRTASSMVPKVKTYVDYRPFLATYCSQESVTPAERIAECPAGNIDMRIRSDGKIIQCSAVRNIFFGDAKRDNLKDIWKQIPKKKAPCPFKSCTLYHGDKNIC